MEMNTDFRVKLLNATFTMLYSPFYGAGKFEELEEKLRQAKIDQDKPGELLGIGKSDLYQLFDIFVVDIIFNQERQSESRRLDVDELKALEAVRTLDEFNHWCFQIWTLKVVNGR